MKNEKGFAAFALIFIFIIITGLGLFLIYLKLKDDAVIKPLNQPVLSNTEIKGIEKSELEKDKFLSSSLTDKKLDKEAIDQTKEGSSKQIVETENNVVEQVKNADNDKSEIKLNGKVNS